MEPPDLLHFMDNQKKNSLTEVPYIRVGTDYFKIIKIRDRYRITGTELKIWKKAEIKEDHPGGGYISKIPKYDSFCIEPDNFNHQPVIDNCYNLYHPFRHKEEKGDCTWSHVLMEHVFGDQIKLGYRYMQLLYLHPDRMAPILVLVSKERQTGKTTYLNWIKMMFGDNCVLINPSDLASEFNSSYATANVIQIEETQIERSLTIEKMKALATGKFINLRALFRDGTQLPFFGKIILSSNNEDKFAKVDNEEIRFFVRKLGTPKHENHNIESDIVKEIPAFLHHLSSLPPIDFTVGRVPFTAEELKNDSLEAVKKESRSGLYKDLMERFTQYFNNLSDPGKLIYATPLDIKAEWYEFNNSIDAAYIKRVLKLDFELKPEPNQRYVPWEKDPYCTKVGMPYEFSCNMFGIDPEIVKKL